MMEQLVYGCVRPWAGSTWLIETIKTGPALPRVILGLDAARETQRGAPRQSLGVLKGRGGSIRGERFVN